MGTNHTSTLMVGPLKLTIQSPHRRLGEGSPELQAFYRPSDDVRLEVTMKVVEVPSGEGAEALLAVELPEGGGPLMGCEGQRVWLAQPGVRSSCDLDAREILLECAPGHQPVFPTRLFATLLLPQLDCVGVHAAAFVRDGKAYLCPGHSEAGKSTSSRLAHAEGIEVLSDDTVVVGWKDDEPVVWGSTFFGDAALASPGPAPLAGIFFLNKGEDRLVPVGLPRAAARLLASTFPETRDLAPALAKGLVERMMDITFRYAAAAPACYDMYFEPKPRFLEMLP